MKTTFNPSEEKERTYLSSVINKLNKTIHNIDEDVRKRLKELKEEKKYLHENKAGMDHVEKISVRQSIDQSALIGEANVAKKSRINRLLPSPYFGRIDFKEMANGKTLPIYIGLHSFYDEEKKQNTIHDWRAPISSMFYDFELGEAHYVSPSGKEEGEITLKRQYRIRNGAMKFMLESSFNVLDDVLQEELSKTADDKMKNIVATIQRDQNAIIRNEMARILIIQGVAGSGKTSIALHRVAFLLYRFKDRIQSKDLLILSPNKVFADYISSVLPELGEEKIPEKGIEELAKDLLKGKYKFQSFFEQVNHLLEKRNDKAYAERVEFKASFEFLSQLNQFLVHVENHFFETEGFKLKKNYIIPDWFIKERFEAYHRQPIFSRFNEVARDIEGNIKLYYKYQITAEERNDIRKRLKKMFGITNLRKLYKTFYSWLDREDMFKLAKHSRLEYSDVFPLIYMKIHLEGSKGFHQVKHLLIDEMQDYTPVQYAVISRLFNCKMTILGDANQSVNPYSSTRSEEIEKVFAGSESVILNKSYRSTYEITEFCREISPNDELLAVERHGNPPVITTSDSEEEEISVIAQMIQQFQNSNHDSLGILCKTANQAKHYHNSLKKFTKEINLLTENSTAFKKGVILTNSHLAKGLEFDRVIVPGVSRKNYHTKVDKCMLYIACTRAMHHLYLTSTGTMSDFVPNINKGQ